MSAQTTGTVKFAGKKDRSSAINTHSQRARSHGWGTYTPARVRKQGVSKRFIGKEVYAEYLNFLTDEFILDNHYFKSTVR